MNRVETAVKLVIACAACVLVLGLMRLFSDPRQHTQAAEQSPIETWTQVGKIPGVAATGVYRHKSGACVAVHYYRIAVLPKEACE